MDVISCTNSQMCNEQHAPTAARANRQTDARYRRDDDTARILLAHTSMPRSQTKCMRSPLAENVSEPPTNVGRDPRGGERDGPQGGRPAPPSAVREPAREAREGRG